MVRVKPEDIPVERLAMLNVLETDTLQLEQFSSYLRLPVSLRLRTAISHWTPRELASEMVKQRIISTISPRHVGRLLAEQISNAPVRLLVKSPDPQFDQDICDTYLSAIEHRAEGGRFPLMK